MNNYPQPAYSLAEGPAVAEACITQALPDLGIEPIGCPMERRRYWTSSRGPRSPIQPKIVVHQGDTEAARKGLELMANAYETDGSWDGGDVDHTCDSTRALILASLVLNDERYADKFTLGVEWLLNNRNSDRLWGMVPGRPSNLLITCDGYDTLQKYRAYLQERGKALTDFLGRWDDF